MRRSFRRLSIVILGKDEEQTIGHCLKQISQQTLFERAGLTTEILVVANGCTDRTADVARSCAAELARPNLEFRVFDLPQGGKSRSWNRAVHEFSDPAADALLFVDSDIRFADETILARIFDGLQADESIAVYTGYPMKSVAQKPHPNLVDRFSLMVSRNTRHLNAICGQLYMICGDLVRTIWLPDETPGEDGFLNAMVRTNGFSRPRNAANIREAETVTHYFLPPSPVEFFVHERRMFVGTMVNRWLFEYLWSLRLGEPAGPLIRDWNLERPDWPQDVIDRNIRARTWLIPREMLLGRLQSIDKIGLRRFIFRLPMALAATLLSIPPAIMANKTLKQKGAASHW